MASNVANLVDGSPVGDSVSNSVGVDSSLVSANHGKEKLAPAIIGAIISGVAALGAGGLSLFGTKMQSDYNEKQIEKQNKYNSPANQMALLSAAGLNPNLAYGQLSSMRQEAVSQQTENTLGNAANLVAAQIDSQAQLNYAAADKTRAEADYVRGPQTDFAIQSSLFTAAQKDKAMQEIEEIKVNMRKMAQDINTSMALEQKTMEEQYGLFLDNLTKGEYNKAIIKNVGADTESKLAYKKKLLGDAALVPYMMAEKMSQIGLNQSNVSLNSAMRGLVKQRERYVNQLRIGQSISNSMSAMDLKAYETLFNTTLPKDFRVSESIVIPQGTTFREFQAISQIYLGGINLFNEYNGMKMQGFNAATQPADKMFQWLGQMLGGYESLQKSGWFKRMDQPTRRYGKRREIGTTTEYYEDVFAL